MHYYTYAYLREDKTPYYIGKGKEDRIYSKQKNIKPPKDKSRIIYLKQNLTEAEAFRHEIYMIAVFGRKDLGTGILHNLTDGGDGSSGSPRSDETKEKIRASLKGRKKFPMSEEQKQKISDAKKGKKCPKGSAAKKGKPSPKKGKATPEDVKLKISKSKKGIPWTEARRLAQPIRKEKTK